MSPNAYDHIIERLINNFSDKDDAEYVALELKNYGIQVIHPLIHRFDEAGPSGKCGIIEVLGHFNHPKSIAFLEKILEEDSDLFFIKSYAEVALDKLKSKEESVLRKLKNLKMKQGIELIWDIAAIGALGDASSIACLDQLQNKTSAVKEQIEVAKFQIYNGIDAIIKEYRNKRSIYNKKALGYAIYNSKRDNQVARVILDDLFSNENDEVLWSLGELSVNKILKEEITPQIIERIFVILESDDFSYNIRENAVQALGNILTINDRLYIERIEMLKSNMKDSKWKWWKFVGRKYFSEEIDKALVKIKRKK